MKLPSHLWFTCFAAFVTVAGCARTGLSPREGPGRDVTSYLYATEAGFAADPMRFAPAAGQGGELDKPPTVARPAALAVAQIGEVAPPTELLERVRSNRELIKDASGISGLMPPSIEGQPDATPDQAAVREHARHMLSVARTMGADYLLVYGGTIDATDQSSPLSLLDITIVGAFVVPSRVLAAEGKATAILLDVNTGHVVATATADDRRTTMATSFGREDAQENQMRRLRDDVVEELADEIVARFERL